MKCKECKGVGRFRECARNDELEVVTIWYYVRVHVFATYIIYIVNLIKWHLHFLTMA